MNILTCLPWNLATDRFERPPTFDGNERPVKPPDGRGTIADEALPPVGQFRSNLSAFTRAIAPFGDTIVGVPPTSGTLAEVSECRMFFRNPLSGRPMTIG
jgi:hypothetical protein